MEEFKTDAIDQKTEILAIIFADRIELHFKHKLISF